jgi:hypothetical protein
MDIYADPASDRDEFSDRLKSMFNTFSEGEMWNKGNVEVDASMMESAKKKADKKKAAIQHFLDEWDKAPDYAARQKVVASVKADYDPIL